MSNTNWGEEDFGEMTDDDSISIRRVRNQPEIYRDPFPGFPSERGPESSAWFDGKRYTFAEESPGAERDRVTRNHDACLRLSEDDCNPQYVMRSLERKRRPAGSILYHVKRGEADTVRRMLERGFGAMLDVHEHGDNFTDRQGVATQACHRGKCCAVQCSAGQCVRDRITIVKMVG